MSLAIVCGISSRFGRAVLAVACFVLVCPPVVLALEFPGPTPGPAIAVIDANNFKLRNSVIDMSWEVIDGRLRPGPLANRLSEKTIPGGEEVFVIVLEDGRRICASDMKLLEQPHCEDLSADATTARASLHHAGKCISVSLGTEDGSLLVDWRAVLREGANYVRQELTLRAQDKDLSIAEIVLGDLPANDARTIGSVRGSPVVAGTSFFACESPFSNNQGSADRVRCSLPWMAPLKAGDTACCASVMGVAPKGQMRRAFLYYIERERARPYRTFLHYNSWYDLVYTDKTMDEGQCLEAIERVGEELAEKRGVQIDGFVFDDGWDDPQTLWGFHAGFPRGFAPLHDTATRYQSAVGTWMSPWGGYSVAKEKRLQYGKTQGFETNAHGFSLAGPKYHARFRDVCRRMIEEYGVRFFKFDGVGAGKEYGKLDPESLSDMAALTRLIGDLRQMRPDLYISLTIGSWPSPYWLWYGDSVWRNGSDWNTCGQGSVRQKWINYRDANTQQMVVRRGPLFPLNSVMNQGITCARMGEPARMNNDLKDVVDEIRMFFGDGTQLQELYISPKVMTPPTWDALAEAAIWSRANADVLVDSHWIGGDAGKSEPYGYASWSPRKGILCVRNPSSEAKVLTLSLTAAFELPQEAAKRYVLKSPWKSDAQLPADIVNAEAEYRIQLEPFEVRVLEAMPQG